MQFEDGSASVELTSIKKMEGEATANNRKAKLIFLFEWELEVNFVGEHALFLHRMLIQIVLESVRFTLS